MARKLNDLAIRVADDVGEKTTDTVIMKKLKRYINRVYKEVAKRQKEKIADVTSVDGKFAQPTHYKKGIQLQYLKTAIDFEEDGTDITCDYSGDMKFIYEFDYESLPDLTDDQEPITDPGNDEIIISGAKYLWWKSENKYNKAEVEKRDYETAYPRRPYRIIQFSVTR